ncbi:unnamed protein product, partial [Laminaria digitata]
GVVRRTRGGQITRRKAASVPQDSEPLISQFKPVEKKQGLLAAYLRALDNRPLSTKVITSGVICGVGDIMAQALAFKPAPGQVFTMGAFAKAVELQRFAIYGVIGALWIAPVVHYWFDLLESVMKSPKGPPKTFAGKMGKALKMVSLDQTIGAPVVNAGFMFLFTFATAVCTGTQGVQASRKSLDMVRGSIWSTLLVCWKIWPVANLINFAFVPANLRVLFMNFVGLGWNIYLSAAVN